MAASGKSKGSSPGSTSKTSKRTRKTPSPSKSAEDTQQQQQQQQAPKTKRRRTSGGTKKATASSSTTKATTAGKKKASTKANANNNAAGKTATEIETPLPTSILVVDNGGDTLKFGWVDDVVDDTTTTTTSTTNTTPRRLPNVTARLKHQWTVLVGDELYNSVQNPNQMHFVTRSTERGIVTNLGNQIQVWKRMLDLLGVVIPNLDHSEAAQAFGWKVTRPGKKAKQQQSSTTTSSCSSTNQKKLILASSVAVLLLVPPHCPRSILDQMSICWFEDFGVSHVGFATSQICAALPHPQYQSGCVVDLGWSATHIVPTFRGTAVITVQDNRDNNHDNNNNEKNNTNKEDVEGLRQIQSAPPTTTAAGTTSFPIRRIPLGGRQLVNIWKYYCSYRQWNLMDQEWLVRDVFEELGYISLNFTEEMELARQTPQGRRPFDRNFVLPDFQTTTRGRVELTEALKQQKAAEEAEEERKRKKKQQQEEEEQEEDEEEDEDFEDTKMEEDVELEADDDVVGDNENVEMDDVEEGKDDEAAEEDNNVLKESESGIDDKGDESNAKRKKSGKKGAKIKEKKRNDTKDDDDDEEETDDNDSDDHDGNDDEDNNEMMRQRLLRQKQEEERRRKEMEAEQQVLTVSVERFTVPEVLFLPSDAGLPAEMAGLAHTIVQSIKACPKYLQPALFRSIQLIGGVAQLPNLMERLQRELRSLAPVELDVKVTMTDNPVDQAWLGAREWARKTPHTQWSVSRDEWEASEKRKAWMKLLVAKGGLLV